MTFWNRVLDIFDLFGFNPRRIRRQSLISTSMSQKECKGPWRLFTFSKEQLPSWMWKKEKQIFWLSEKCTTSQHFLHICTLYWIPNTVSGTFLVLSGVQDTPSLLEMEIHVIELTIAPHETRILVDYQILYIIKLFNYLVC